MKLKFYLFSGTFGYPWFWQVKDRCNRECTQEGRAVCGSDGNTYSMLHSIKRVEMSNKN